MPFYSSLKRFNKSQPDKVARVSQQLMKLRTALRKHLKAGLSSPDAARGVRIATWNLREFGGKKYGGRDFEPLYYIAEIISHFDIVAVQEVRSDLDELEELMRILGPDWDYLATDVTDGHAGNDERMVFLFDRTKVLFRNMAGELTLPSRHKVLTSFGERIRLSGGAQLMLPDNVDLSGVYKASTRTDKGKIKLDQDLEIPLPEGAWVKLPDGCALTVTKNSVIRRPKKGHAEVTIPNPKVAGKPYRLRLPGGLLDDSFRQFARTPYVVTFQSGWLKLNLCTVHIYFGDNEVPALLAQRQGEIEALTTALGKRAEKELKKDPLHRTFLGLLGDFNIISPEHGTMKALERNGFVVDDSLKKIPGSNVAKDKAYDQIAFWRPDHAFDYIKLDLLGAGVFDFFNTVYRKQDSTTYRKETGRTANNHNTWRTYKMSDHLLMWVELRNDFGPDYLKQFKP